MFRTLSLSLLFAFGVNAAQAAPYAIDHAHTQVWFNVSHMGFSELTGQFRKLDGQLNFDPADMTKSSVKVSIPVDGIDMNDDKLNTHLKSADFFDAAKFPNMEFKSNKVEKVSENVLKVSGDLSIHGVTKPATLDVKINKVADHPMMKVPAVGLSASTTIKRSDFGIKYGVPAVGDDITIRIAMEAQQAAQTAPAKP